MPEGPTLFLGIDSSAARAGAEQFKQAAASAGQAATQTESAVSRLGSEMAKITPTASGASRSIDDYSGSFLRLVKNIDPALVAEAKLRDGIRVLDNEFRAGRISAEQYGSYLTTLRNNLDAAATAGKSAGLGMSLFTAGLKLGVVNEAINQISGLGRSFIDAADTSIRLSSQLRIATGSTDNATAAFNGLFEIAQRTGAPVENLVQLFSRVSATAKDLGISQRDLMGLTEGVASSLRISGESAAGAGGALLQLSQSLGGSKVQAQEFNSVMDGLRPLVIAAANHIEGANGSLGKLKEMVNAGKLSTEEWAAALVAGAEDVARSAGTMEGTVGQAVQRITNSFLAFSGALNETSGFSRALNWELGNLSRGLDVVTNALKRYSEFRSGFQSRMDAIHGVENNTRDENLAKLARQGQEVEPDKPYGPPAPTPAILKEQADLAKVDLSILKERSSATKDLTEKRAALLTVAKAEYEQEKVAASQKYSGGQEARALAQIEAQYEARKASAIADTTPRPAASRGGGGGRQAVDTRLADASRAAAEEKRIMAERQRDQEYLLGLEVEVARKGEDALALIDAARAKRYDELAQKNTLTGEERRGASLNIEALAAEQSKTELLRQNAIDSSKADYLSSAKIKGLEANAELTKSDEERQRLVLAAIEERRIVEIRAIDEVADKYSLSEDEKRMAIEATNRSAGAAAKKAIDGADTMAKDMQYGFQMLETTVNGIFADMIMGVDVTTETIARSFQKMFIQIALHAIENDVIGPLLKQGIGIGISLLGAAFGGAGAGAGASTGVSTGAAMSGGGYTGSSTFILHEGGRVGIDAIPTRWMPSAMFDHAPRLHQGLKSGEYPAVLQYGETVTPAGQSAETLSFANNLTVNVNNPQGDGKKVGDDVARIVKQSVEEQVKMVLRKEMRPGGAMRSGVDAFR